MEWAYLVRWKCKHRCRIQRPWQWWITRVLVQIRKRRVYLYDRCLHFQKRCPQVYIRYTRRSRCVWYWCHYQKACYDLRTHGRRRVWLVYHGKWRIKADKKWDFWIWILGIKWADNAKGYPVLKQLLSVLPPWRNCYVISRDTRCDR